MALFQRRPQVSSHVSYATSGLGRTLAIVGLGNPEPAYDGTRHNIGFLCAEAFVAAHADMGGWREHKELKCMLSTGQLADSRIIVAKPTTYMNLSGEAVAAISRYYRLTPGQFVVVHDELDIAFGQIRSRKGGSSAGHNGIKSITEAIGSDYGRVRIGIGPKHPPQIDSSDFVLQRFDAAESALLPQLTRETNALLSEYAYGAELLPETRSFLI